MKDKIIFLVIGFLIGAIVATGAFYLYNKSNNNIQMNGGQIPQLPNGQSGEPPEKPNGENTEPPEKPSENTQENNQTESN